MSLIYNKVYRVPAWVIIKSSKTTVKPLTKAFKDLGAHEVKWMSSTFPVTISILATQGWAHEVNKTMPFFATPDFLNYALARHIAGFGLNKTLTGTTANAMNSINRRVGSVDDYARIFNELITHESDISLSHLLAIGELCHGEREQVKVFVSSDEVPKNIAQRLSDRVITLGGDGCDVTIASKLSVEEIDNIVGRVAAILGYKK